MCLNAWIMKSESCEYSYADLVVVRVARVISYVKLCSCNGFKGLMGGYSRSQRYGSSELQVSSGAG